MMIIQQPQLLILEKAKKKDHPEARELLHVETGPFWRGEDERKKHFDKWKHLHPHGQLHTRSHVEAHAQARSSLHNAIASHHHHLSAKTHPSGKAEGEYVEDKFWEAEGKGEVPDDLNSHIEYDLARTPQSKHHESHIRAHEGLETHYHDQANYGTYPGYKRHTKAHAQLAQHHKKAAAAETDPVKRDHHLAMYKTHQAYATFGPGGPKHKAKNARGHSSFRQRYDTIERAVKRHIMPHEAHLPTPDHKRAFAIAHAETYKKKKDPYSRQDAAAGLHEHPELKHYFPKKVHPETVFPKQTRHKQPTDFGFKKALDAWLSFLSKSIEHGSDLDFSASHSVLHDPGFGDLLDLAKAEPPQK